MRAVIVEWLDARMDGDWRDVKAAREQAIVTVQTLGWVLSETEDVLTVAPSIGSGDIAMGVLSIPRKAIVKQKDL